MAPLAMLNNLPRPDAERELRRCCGSARWAATVAGARPFGTLADLLAAAERAFDGLDRDDWLEAFAHHPRIGERGADHARLAATAAWSAAEQSAMAGAAEDLRRRLAEANLAYERRFGHVFLIRAAGRSPAEMLAALERRLANDPSTELGIAAAEQRQITRLRLERLVRDP
jgi:OHCU decarboxylase